MPCVVACPSGNTFQPRPDFAKTSSSARSSPSTTPAIGRLAGNCWSNCNFDACSDDFVFDNQMLAQILWHRRHYRRGKLPDALRKGIVVDQFPPQRGLRTGLFADGVVYRLCRWGFMKSPCFRHAARFPPRRSTEYRQRRQYGITGWRGGREQDCQPTCAAGLRDRTASGRDRRTRRHGLRRRSTRSCVSSGTSPSNGTSISAARRLAPPQPKISCRALQLGQMKKLMFSTMPSTSIWSLRNMVTALVASNKATSWGVQTTTAAASFTYLRSETARHRFPAAYR